MITDHVGRSHLLGCVRHSVDGAHDRFVMAEAGGGHSLRRPCGTKIKAGDQREFAEASPFFGQALGTEWETSHGHGEYVVGAQSETDG